MAVTLLLIHAAATLYLMGLIWFVQVVHYPLFDGVGAERFAEYEQRHTRRTTWVVLPPMVVELVTAIWLAARPSALVPSVPAWLPWAGLALVVFVWAVTFAASVPQHRKLLDGFDARAHHLLVATNWLRTAAWLLRGVLVVWMLALVMRG